MQRRPLLFAVGAWLTLAVVPQAFGGAKPATPSTCGHYGTSVEFVRTPAEAAQRAKQEQKLVFVLHVSGHFENPDFT